MVGLPPGDVVVVIQGQYVVFSIGSTSLRSHKRLNLIIVASHRMFTPIRWLLG